MIPTDFSRKFRRQPGARRRPSLAVRVRSLALAAVGVSLFAGCNILPQAQPDNVRYFTLSQPPDATAPAGNITVRPVQLAGHLRNRAMAVRVAENEVTYLDDIRWAEPLADAITQTLRNRLAPVPADAVVSVRILRCELARSKGNAVELAAVYTIDRRGEPLRRGTFLASPKTWDGKDYGALVALLHDSVGELGDALAAALSEKK